jgi:hypothetical protein
MLAFAISIRHLGVAKQAIEPRICANKLSNHLGEAHINLLNNLTI